MTKRSKIIIVVVVILSVLACAIPFCLSIYRSEKNFEAFKKVNDDLDQRNRSELNPAKFFGNDLPLSDKTDSIFLDSVSRKCKRAFSLIAEIKINFMENSGKKNSGFGDTVSLVKLKNDVHEIISFIEKTENDELGKTIKSFPLLYDEEVDGKKMNWEESQFKNMPLAVIITNLSLIQSQLNNGFVSVKKTLSQRIIKNG